MEDDLRWNTPHNIAMGGDGVILLDGEADGAVDGLVGQLGNMDVDPPPPLVGEEGGWQVVHLKVQGQVFPVFFCCSRSPYFGCSRSPSPAQRSRGIHQPLESNPPTLSSGNVGNSTVTSLDARIY